MSIETPTWDKISGGLGSTNKEFGGNWANLISDYYNGINLALLDASKIPIIGTLTRYKFEKLGLFDVDQSHYVSFSVDDIDTGTNRKIKFRRMNTPFEEDYAVLEGLAQAIINKTIDADLNSISNIENADIKAAAAIVTSKLADSANFAFKNSSNIFTSLQSIEANIDPSLELYKTSNSGDVGMDFYAQTSTSAKRKYGGFDVHIQTNTNADEDSYIALSVIKDGTFGTKWLFNHTGGLYLRPGTSGAFGIIDPASIATTDKTFTLPNITGTLLTDNSTASPTNKTLLDSGTGNVIGVHVPYTFTIYQTASNYIVRNNATGALTSFSNSDFTPALHSAINNIVNVGLGTQDTVFGGSIFIQRGIYTSTTGITPDIDVATRHGIVIVGEGMGTQIYLNPPSSLTDGFLVDMVAFEMRDIRIVANQYVTNLVHMTGHVTGRKNNHYTFKHVSFEGPNGDFGNSATPTLISGQKGLLIDGANIASYHGTVFDCKFFALETGLHLNGVQATSIKCTNSVFWQCEYSIIQEGSSGQNQFNNLWLQGSATNGYTGIWIKNAGGYTYIDNIHGEFHRENPPSTDVACQTILVDSGVANLFIGRNISNAHDGLNATSKTIVNNSTAVNYTPYHWNLESKNFITITPSSDLVTFNSSRRMQFSDASLYIKDTSGNSFNYIFKASSLAASRNVTLPSLPGADTFVFEAFTQTLTNKTYDAEGTGNVLSNVKNSNIKSGAAIDWSKISKTGSVLTDIADVVLTTPADQDILVRNSSGNWVNLPKSTNSRFLQTNSSGVLAWNFIGDVSIATHTSTKISITNKAQLNSAILYNDTDNLLGAHFLGITKMTAPAAAAANSLNIYMDTATNHIKAKNSNDSVFNITGAVNPVTGLKVGGYDAASATRGWGIFGSDLNQSTPTGVTTLDSTNGVCQLFATTGAVAGNGAHLRYGNQYTTRAWNPTLSIKFMLSHASANRVHMGWRSTVSGAIADGTDDPLSGISGIMLCQRAADTVWQIATNNATTTTFTPVAGNPTIAASTLYTIEFRADNTNSKFQYSFNGGAWTDITATIPSASTFLGFYVGIQTDEAVAHNFRIYSVGTTSEK